MPTIRTAYNHYLNSQNKTAFKRSLMWMTPTQMNFFFWMTWAFTFYNFIQERRYPIHSIFQQREDVNISHPAFVVGCAQHPLLQRKSKDKLLCTPYLMVY